MKYPEYIRTPAMQKPQHPITAQKRALFAGSVGNFIEWYEFAVYGFLATIIAQNFFRLQGEDELTDIILTYASFAIAFFSRPLGAVFLDAWVTDWDVSRL